MYRKSDHKRIEAFLNFYPELQEQLREGQLKVSGRLCDVLDTDYIYDLFYEEEDADYIDECLRSICKPEQIERVYGV